MFTAHDIFQVFHPIEYPIFSDWLSHERTEYLKMHPDKPDEQHFNEWLDKKYTRCSNCGEVVLIGENFCERCRKHQPSYALRIFFEEDR